MRGCLRTFDGQEYSFGEKSSTDCFCCGYCCVGYNPLVTDEEIDVIAKYLKISASEFKHRYIKETLIGYLVLQTEKGCVFLKPEKDSAKAYCGIHPARPSPCRDWIPSLWRIECCEGLARLRKDSRILLVDEIYENPEQIERFCASLTQPDEG
ncbi:YkgJ family cysteine cluster protein [Chloroflexota bacterium]